MRQHHRAAQTAVACADAADDFHRAADLVNAVRGRSEVHNGSVARRQRAGAGFNGHGLGDIPVAGIKVEINRARAAGTVNIVCAVIVPTELNNHSAVHNQQVVGSQRFIVGGVNGHNNFSHITTERILVTSHITEAVFTVEIGVGGIAQFAIRLKRHRAVER